MKKQCKPIIFYVITAFSLMNLLCYFAIRPMWSGIILYSSHAVPYILLAAITVTGLSAVLLSLHKRFYLAAGIIIAIISLFFFGLEWYIISLTTEAYKYFIREFLYGLGYVCLIAFLVYLLFYFPRTKLYQQKWLKPVILVAMFLGLLIWIFQLIPNKITSTPVVYAVEDTYQIVFTSRAKGTAWIQVGDQEYNDTYAGYRSSESTVHKISIPMEVLDKAGKYTIYTRSMLLRGPYCALQGTTLSKTYPFRPVNAEDGLDYYVISDVHNDLICPTAAADYFGDKLDFIITCGDTVSWVDRPADLSFALKLLGEITKGEIPVIYARGNHETKGVDASQLYQYVGSVNQKFYYTFRLNNIWGIVLDLGEDHEDEFIEYSGIAKFNDYRQEQVDFLDEVITNKENEYDAEGIDYRIAVCHIPVTFEYKNDHCAAYKPQWIERLNQMKLTVLYSGHVHELMFVDNAFEAGATLTFCKEYTGERNKNSYTMTAANFPSILVARKSEGQQLTYPETVLDKRYIGLAVHSDGSNTTLTYTNEKKEIIDNIISPWFSDIIYGDHIIIKNNRQ